jgi:hypothetical protein
MNDAPLAYVSVVFPYNRVPSARFYMEIRADGFPTREIAVDENDQIIHRFPDERFEDGRYGVFADGYGVDPSESEPIPKEVFDALWSRPTDPPFKEGLMHRLRRLLNWP